MNLTFDQFDHLPPDQRQVLVALRGKSAMSPRLLHCRLGWSRTTFQAVTTTMLEHGLLVKDEKADTLRVDEVAVIRSGRETRLRTVAP